MDYTMKDYLKDSERTVATGQVNLDMFESVERALHQGVDIISSGNSADISKRSMFYKTSNEKLQERSANAINTMTSIYESLEEGYYNPKMTLSDNESKIYHGILGVASEAGEMMEEFIQAKIEGRELDLVNMCEEVGDVLWYLALILRETGGDFESVSEKNINKLKARFPEKFSTDKANNRDLDTERKILEQ